MTIVTSAPTSASVPGPPPPAPVAVRRPAAGGTPRRRRFARRLQVQLAMVVAGVAIVAFALSVHQAVTDAQETVTAVGQDDTSGIRAAQRVKSDLAELDLITTQELLEPTATDGNLPDAYVRKHKELVADLDAASQQITLGTAETVPLANLEYERAQYHALARDAILADQQGDRAEALSLARQAHDVMTGTLGLQQQADAFDKANTYALNQSYARHRSSTTSSGQMLLVTGIGLLAVLVVIQLWHVLGFHRVLNIGLVLATFVAAGVFVYSTSRIDASDQHLREAREQAFDPVHELWQARAAAYGARQAEAQALLDPTGAAEAETTFQGAAARLYRLPDAASDVAQQAQAFQVPIGVGGYLANELRNESISDEAAASTRGTLTAFAAYLDAHDQMRSAAAATGNDGAVRSFLGQESSDSGYAFARLVGAIDETLALNEAAFTVSADEAAHALDGIEVVNIVVALALALLVVWGLSQRLREYSGT